MFGASPGAIAGETRVAEELYFSGHATLGALYNTDQDTQFFRNLNQRNSDLSQFSYESDSRLGLRLSYRPHRTLGGELQLLTRYGLSNQFETNVFAANLRYKPGNNWLIRAGIVPIESFYRSDSIHVGYSYLWARPPSEVHALNIASTMQGAAVQKQFFFGFNALEVKLFGGQLNRHYSTHPNDQYNGRNSNIYGVTLEYVGSKFYASAGYTHLDISDESLDATRNNLFLPITSEQEVDQATVDLLNLALIDEPELDYVFLGFGYESGPWRIDSTIAATEAGFTTFNDAYNGYLSVGYKTGRFTPFVLISAGHNNAPNQLHATLPPLVEASILAGAQEAQGDQITYAVGTRYDISSTLSLKAQWSHVNSQVNPSYLWRNETEDWDLNTNLLSLVLDVTF